MESKGLSWDKALDALKYANSLAELRLAEKPDQREQFCAAILERLAQLRATDLGASHQSIALSEMVEGGTNEHEENPILAEKGQKDTPTALRFDSTDGQDSRMNLKEDKLREDEPTAEAEAEAEAETDVALEPAVGADEQPTIVSRVGAPKGILALLRLQRVLPVAPQHAERQKLDAWAEPQPPHVPDPAITYQLSPRPPATPPLVSRIKGGYRVDLGLKRERSNILDQTKIISKASSRAPRLSVPQAASVIQRCVIQAFYQCSKTASIVIDTRSDRCTNMNCTFLLVTG
eukprot:SAG11_NODE_1182_length_5595_cov_1.928311_4_plen_290_part_00